MSGFLSRFKRGTLTQGAGRDPILAIHESRNFLFVKINSLVFSSGSACTKIYEVMFEIHFFFLK